MLRLFADLLVASSADAILELFRAFIGGAHAELYVSLWYLDLGSEVPCLLLAAEFGTKYGGTVRPDHNRLPVGTGIVGIAAATGEPQHYDMSNPEHKQLAASRALIETEKLVSITALPWDSSDAFPGGAIVLGARDQTRLTVDDEGLIEYAARQVLGTLVQRIEDRSRSIVPRLVSELSELSSAEDILEVALKILAPDFRVDFGIAVTVTAHDYLATIQWKHNSIRRQTAMRPRGLELRGLPGSVRLFHAMDPDELAANNIPPRLTEWLREQVTGSVTRHDHVIASYLGTRRQSTVRTGGFILLAREADSLAFLPEESRVLGQAAEHIGLLIALNRREELRQRVVRATGDVATGGDLQLAVLSFFVSTEDIVSYRIASLVLERDSDTWEAYCHIPDARQVRRAPTIDALLSEPLEPSDPAVRAIDRVALELLDVSEEKIPERLDELASELQPPPAHRAAAEHNTDLVRIPLLFGTRVRGAVFLSPKQAAPLAEDQLKYIRTVAQQLAVAWNVQRLRGTDERFFELVDGFDRLFSGSMLSLALSHETKGKLGTFAGHFDTVQEVAKQLASHSDSSVASRAKTLMAIASAGMENIQLLDELARAISDALLADEDGSVSAQTARANPPQSIYLNDVIRLYHRGLREASRDEDGRLTKQIDISRLTSALDKPKSGSGHPLSTEPFDRIRLGQVLSNLVLNALDASPPRGKVEVETAYLEDGKAALIVRDFGVGMTDEVKVRLFEPFFSRKQGNREGFGLGMLIVRTLVRDLGGDLTFVTKRGGGTTFTVVLPLPVRGGVGTRRASAG